MTTTQQVRRKVREYNRLSYFDRLKLLITRLNPLDKKRVINYLNCFEHEYKSETKTTVLFLYLLDNPQASEALAQEHVDVKKVKSFNALVETLRDKIGYCLTNEKSTQGKDCEYSDRVQAESEVIKKLFRASLYRGRKNLPEEAILLLNHVIRVSKKYEIYFPLVQALHYKRNFMALREGTKEHAEHTADILYYDNCLQVYLKAWEYFDEYSRFCIYDGYKSDFTDKFRNKVIELEKGYQECQSTHVGFYFFQIKIGYLFAIKRHEEARHLAEQLLTLVRESPAIHSNERMGMAYGTLADVLVFCREFKQSLETVQAAQNYLLPNTLNYSFSQELEFWALFYSAEYEKAEKKISSILNNPKYRHPSFFINKRKYLHACALFALGNYAKCLNILESITEIQDDVRGWNIGIKILSILRAISDHENEELTILKIRSFKYEIDKLRERKVARGRDLVILKLLYKLLKSNFDFKSIYKKYSADFELLESEDPEYRWEIESHEVIVFHIWFKCMMLRQRYKADLSQEKISKFAYVQ